MKGGVTLFIYYKCHKLNPNFGGSYMDSSNWIKEKKKQIATVKEIINAFNTLQQSH